MARAVQSMHVEVSVGDARSPEKGALIMHIAKDPAHGRPVEAYGHAVCAIGGEPVWKSPASDGAAAAAYLRGAPAVRPICCCCARAWLDAGAPVMRL